MKSYHKFTIDRSSIDPNKISPIAIHTKETVYEPFRFSWFKPMNETKHTFVCEYEKNIGKKPTIISEIHVGTKEITYTNILDKITENMN